MVITCRVRFLSFWLSQTLMSSQSRPAESPQGLSPVCCPVLSTLWVCDVCPPPLLQSPCWQTGCLQRGHRFCSQGAASPGTILSSASESFLAFLMWARQKWDDAVFPFWGMHGLPGRAGSLVRLLFSCRSIALSYKHWVLSPQGHVGHGQRGNILNTIVRLLPCSHLVPHENTYKYFLAD